MSSLGLLGLMRVNTSIGEVLVTARVDGRATDFLFRPSFSALSRIGAPEQIESVIKGCLDCMESLTSGLINPEYRYSCVSMINACCEDEEITRALFGYWQVKSRKGEERLVFIEGAETAENTIVLANHLVKWGVVGKPKRRVTEGDKVKKDFDPFEYVGSAIAHLGLSTNEAWQLTMTEFQAAIDAKFPPEKPIKDSQDISDDRYDEMMRQHDEIISKVKH